MTDYSAAHVRVARTRGKAAAQLCVDCGAPAADWSYIGGAPDEQHGHVRSGGKVRTYPFSLDPAYYAPRCRACHRDHDARRNPSGHRRLLAAVLNSDHPVTARDVAEQIGMPIESVRATLSRAANHGQITRCGYGRYTRPEETA